MLCVDQTFHKAEHLLIAINRKEDKHLFQSINARERFSYSLSISPSTKVIIESRLKIITVIATFSEYFGKVSNPNDVEIQKLIRYMKRII